MKKNFKKNGRLQKLVIVNTEYIENLENLEEEERVSEELDLKDPNFESELTFDGYANIEDYDNSAYQVRESEAAPDEYSELRLHDRAEILLSGEEDILDPQDHKGTG